MNANGAAIALHSTVEHDFETGLAYVRLRGILDLASAPRARTAVLKCAAEHPQAVIVDLDRVIVASQTPLLVFATVSRLLIDHGVAMLIVANPHTPIGKSVRRALSGRVAVHSTRRDAVEATAKGPAPPHRVHVHLPMSPTSPAVARALAKYACESWDVRDIADSAQIVASELVSNAVVHARTDLDVTFILRANYLVIQVRDRGKQSLPRPTHGQYTPGADHGRGLALVARLTSSWGHSVGPHGKTVWATIRARPLA
ncbi:MAG TPA: ATP-binding protein [Micromonosporaceae bacterium]|nr:ATP-binding protein [Micromonosporaceae bacterium]